MTAISPLAILLFGVAIGACLPALIRTLRRWYRRVLFRPTLLKLDAAAPPVDDRQI
ncbi:MAG: hypothetical protein H7327_07680 [Herminiimonas sp.]|nr:hypothetical protein [Herminiimonas sp.]